LVERLGSIYVAITADAPSNSDPADPANQGYWAMTHGTKVFGTGGPVDSSAPIGWVQCNVAGVSGVVYVPIYQ
jgi:hypothetical protein